LEEIKLNKWNKLVKSQKSKSNIDNQIEIPEQIKSYFFIFDCFDNKILFTNTAFKTVTGYETHDLNLDFLLKIIHPDDLNYFFESEERFLEFTNKLLFNEHFKYSHSYSYRIKTKSGKYIRIFQECQALEVNNSGHLTKTLVNHKIVEYTENVSVTDFKIYDKSQNSYIDAENRYNLTKRELEILNLIKSGLNSQQISDKLSISKNTILTHRKNILNKTNCSSFIELIKKLSYVH
jgi:DNA-binding CsgD family transcriptional regulator